MQNTVGGLYTLVELKFSKGTVESFGVVVSLLDIWDHFVGGGPDSVLQLLARREKGFRDV